MGFPGEYTGAARIRVCVRHGRVGRAAWECDARRFGARGVDGVSAWSTPTPRAAVGPTPPTRITRVVEVAAAYRTLAKMLREQDCTGRLGHVTYLKSCGIQQSVEGIIAKVFVSVSIGT